MRWCFSMVPILFCQNSLFCQQHVIYILVVVILLMFVNLWYVFLLYRRSKNMDHLTWYPLDLPTVLTKNAIRQPKRNFERRQTLGFRSLIVMMLDFSLYKLLKIQKLFLFAIKPPSFLKGTSRVTEGDSVTYSNFIVWNRQKQVLVKSLQAFFSIGVLR